MFLYVAYAGANSVVDTAGDVAIEETINYATGQESTTTTGSTARTFGENFAGNLVTGGAYGKVKKVKKIKQIADAVENNKAVKKTQEVVKKVEDKVDNATNKAKDKLKRSKTAESPDGPNKPNQKTNKENSADKDIEKQKRLEKLKIQYGRADLDKDINAGKGYKDVRQKNEYTPENYPNPDPDMDAPEVKYTPESFEEIERMRKGKGPRTKKEYGDQNIEAHHRQQKSIENSDGKMDELTQQTHRGEGNHTRHEQPSELTDSQRAKEIREHYKSRGQEYNLPGDDY